MKLLALLFVVLVVASCNTMQRPIMVPSFDSTTLFTSSPARKDTTHITLTSSRPIDYKTELFSEHATDTMGAGFESDSVVARPSKRRRKE